MLPYYARQLFNMAIRTIERVTMQEWLYILAIAAVAGMLCMRGFGSRSSH